MRDHPDNLVPLADYARGTAVLGATAALQTCRDCPTRSECRRYGDCQWGDDTDPPGPTLRLTGPPDIVA